MPLVPGELLFVFLLGVHGCMWVGGLSFRPLRVAIFVMGSYSRVEKSSYEPIFDRTIVSGRSTKI